MSRLVYHFDWDPHKARTNLVKHGIEFLLATSVFRDPLALTIYDDEHSQTEERWVTIGQAVTGQTLVVVHSSQYISPSEVTIRIISARRADRDERRNYEDAPH